MNSYQSIFQEILNEIIPTQSELDLIDFIVKEIRELLQARAKELHIEYTQIEPQGSTGIKQTQLRNDFDIDLFVGLNYDSYREKYEGLSKNKFKKESKKDFLYLCNEWIIEALKDNRFENSRLLYAEHPYVSLDYLTESHDKIKIDVVLYFDLSLEYIKKNGPVTAVDRSPWHGRFVKENLTMDQKNDVRLLKQFFKACHSYGDKSAVGMVGFIGYSAELLIYHYETVLKVLKDFKNLPHNPLDYYQRTKKQLNKIKHFTNDFLIIVDPIDENRNVASAISEKAYRYCNFQVQQFLKHPKKEAFVINPIKVPDLSDQTDPLLSKIFLMEFENTDPERHYTINRDKLYSLGDSIKAHAEKEFSHQERFGTIYFEVYFEHTQNEYNLALYCQKPKISETFTRRGPPLKAKKHVDRFKEKNPDFYEKDGFLWVETQRSHFLFLNFLREFIEDKIPENLKIVNISSSFGATTKSGKRSITVLKDMVLPFYSNQK